MTYGLSRTKAFAASALQWFLRQTTQAESVPATSRRQLPTRIDAQEFSTLFTPAISRLTTRSKQLLMLSLYADKNLFVERLIDFLVNPIIGAAGFTIEVHPDAPQTKAVFDRFLKFNKLNNPQVVRYAFRDALLTGELCYLKVPHAKRNTFQLVQVHAPVIRQTLVDPGNYTELIAVEQDTGVDHTILHRIISDEDRLSSAAVAMRSQMPFSCYLFQLCKRSHPTPSPYFGGDPLRRYEIRGEPYLINSSDLLEALLRYLWTSLDKADAWNRFNYVFDVNVKGKDEEDYVAKLKVWQEYIGTPKSNSAIFLPPHLKMNAVTFPMQSQDLNQLYRMFRNVASWHAATRETSMGEGDVRYASNESPGVSEPTVETKEVLQADFMTFFRSILDDIGFDAIQRGEIPFSELKDVTPEDERRYRRGETGLQDYALNYTVSGNAISDRSQQAAMTAFNTFVTTMGAVTTLNAATPESVNTAIQQKAKELAQVTLTPPEILPVPVIPEVTAIPTFPPEVQKNPQPQEVSAP